MKKPLSIITAAIILTTAFTGCHRDNTNLCPGAVTASWKVNNSTYQMHNTFTAGQVGSYMNMVLVACTSDGVDRSVAFNFIPYPPTVGVYDIKYTSGHGLPWNGTLSGIYITGSGNSGTSYFTDSTTHTGTFSVTGVNTTAKTFSGTFDFNAVDDAGTSTVHVTEGTYTANYN